VILRVNDDGTSPTDNPSFDQGRAIGGEIGQNVERIFAYGIRNSFAMTFDLLSGSLWQQENDEDAFDGAAYESFRR
jgi:aldose sugar dehydrogenase